MKIERLSLNLQGHGKSWREYLCLGEPDADVQDDPDAAADVADAHLVAAFAGLGEGSAEAFAISLKEVGYVKLSDFRGAAGDGDLLQPWLTRALSRMSALQDR